MPQLRPFAGLRYAQERVIDLAQVLVPPYDVISAAQRAAFRARHPVNIGQIVVGEEGTDWQRQAAARFAEWRQAGILRQDAQPALYLLQQHFSLPDGRRATRTGVIGRLKIVPWGRGVWPHERTFPNTIADRLKFRQATRAHFSPIFLFYQDPQGRVLTPATFMLESEPAVCYKDETGVEHRLWALTDNPAIEAITQALENHALYVADGHHRYETALAYQRLTRANNGSLITADERPEDFALAYVTSGDDPGTVVLPAHRCVRAAYAVEYEKVLQGLRMHFELESFADETILLQKLASTEGGNGVVAMVHREAAGGWLLRRRNEPATTEAMYAADPPPVAALDTAMLQSLILGPVFGVSREPAGQKQALDFLPEAAAAIHGVHTGRYTCAFLLNATPLDQIITLAQAGYVAPQKTTYFYPKLPSGLVIYAMDTA